MRKATPRFPKARLDALIEQATTDAYGDGEQIAGFLASLQDELKTPFTVRLFGLDVEVVGVEDGYRDDVVAMCRNRQGALRVPVLELPVPDPLPEGWEWVEAFRKWSGPS